MSDAIAALTDDLVKELESVKADLASWRTQVSNIQKDIDKLWDKVDGCGWSDCYKVPGWMSEIGVLEGKQEGLKLLIEGSTELLNELQKAVNEVGNAVDESLSAAVGAAQFAVDRANDTVEGLKQGVEWVSDFVAEYMSSGVMKAHSMKACGSASWDPPDPLDLMFEALNFFDRTIDLELPKFIKKLDFPEEEAEEFIHGIASGIVEFFTGKPLENKHLKLMGHCNSFDARLRTQHAKAISMGLPEDHPISSKIKAHSCHQPDEGTAEWNSMIARSSAAHRLRAARASR